MNIDVKHIEPTLTINMVPANCIDHAEARITTRLPGFTMQVTVTYGTFGITTTWDGGRGANKEELEAQIALLQKALEIINDAH